MTEDGKINQLFNDVESFNSQVTALECGTERIEPHFLHWDACSIWRQYRYLCLLNLTKIQPHYPVPDAIEKAFRHAENALKNKSSDPSSAEQKYAQRFALLNEEVKTFPEKYRPKGYEFLAWPK